MICWKNPARRPRTSMRLCGCLTVRPTPACTARRCSLPWSTGVTTAGSVAWSAATLAPPRGSCFPPSHPSHWGSVCLAMMNWPCRTPVEIIALIEVSGRLNRWEILQNSVYLNCINKWHTCQLRFNSDILETVVHQTGLWWDSFEEEPQFDLSGDLYGNITLNEGEAFDKRDVWTGKSYY